MPRPMSRRGLILTVVGSVALAAGGWFLTDLFYLRQHSEIQKTADRLTRETEAFKAASEGSRESRVALREFAGTMLGAEQVLVEHRLRDLLSALAQNEGLKEVVVSHGKPRVADNPAQGRGSGVNRALRRALSKQRDFAVVQARVQGLGSLEQVLRTLAAIRGQPWIHRVEGFTITPKGRELLNYELKADLATLYAPDLVSADAEPPVLHSPDASSLSRIMAMVERDPFRLATPVVVAPPSPPTRPPPPTDAPPPRLPYDKWRVTGVLEKLGPGGATVQVMLARVDTGELRTLKAGDELLGVTLESASGESALFVLDGRRVVVRTGQTLAQAEPAESVHSGSPPHPHG